MSSLQGAERLFQRYNWQNTPRMRSRLVMPSEGGHFKSMVNSVDPRRYTSPENVAALAEPLTTSGGEYVS
jgi:hypothetical protein